MEGMLATLDLRARQDIIMGYLLNMLLPQDDLIDFEVTTMLSATSLHHSTECLNPFAVQIDLHARIPRHATARLETADYHCTYGCNLCNLQIFSMCKLPQRYMRSLPCCHSTLA